ncbi:conserved hypothetical protein [Vibrio aestuarianus]|uniref:Uncharacterized protein n=1 Tax=Vibrio aestuarianus TaxID=28171 RepID=A0ABM9FI35_9VIBR|nr:hypothetical protein [Vibrio aestuarianus]MDE1258115.1 hypothetical protein [Vibrio aestuarianus]CAH8188425.1 conserved hypothetical protein [Vibrio aestuarianus]CAH8214777.1 conserved hypothetical protein [Vibrio aestuarianus]
MFKNPFRPSQLAENTERILNEIVKLTSKTHPTHNAQLSGEQRDHNPKPLRLKHKTQPRAETPKRWESVLNA